jgi:hypothetical protein
MRRRGNCKGIGPADVGVGMDDADEVQGVVPRPAELVFILGPRGRPCPRYMLRAIGGNKRSQLWEECGVVREAGRHELWFYRSSHHPYICCRSRRLGVVSVEGLDKVWSMDVSGCRPAVMGV